MNFNLSTVVTLIYLKDDLKSHLRRSIHVEDEEAALQLKDVEDDEQPSYWSQSCKPVFEVLRKLGILEEEDPGTAWKFPHSVLYPNLQIGYFKEKMRSNFLFRSPELYFSVIDHVLMLISFYMALWVVNFSYSTASFPNQSDRINWIVASLVPGIASALLFIYVVRTSFLVKVKLALH